MRLKFTVGSDLDVIPRSYWEYTGTAPTDAQLVTMATGIFSSNASGFGSLLADSSYFTGVELVDLSSDTAAIGEYFSSHTGTRGAGELPASAAADIAFSIARRYRGGKPHTELPFGIASDLQTGQTWTSSFITAAQGQWTNLVASMTSELWTGGGTISQVNVSYYGPPNRTVTSSTGRVRTISTTRTTPLIDPVLSFACQSRLGTVRRRLGKAA